MSFLSKVWGGIKKAVKGIGKGIKKAVGVFGKFMDKIGIVGQIALMFILPGVGALIGKGVGMMAAAANPMIAGVGKILTTAGKFASTAGNAFKTITDGITSFASNISKGMINKTASLLGKNTPVFATGPASVTEGVKQWMKGVAHDAANITTPFRTAATEVTSEVIESPYEKFFSGEIADSVEAPALGAPTFDTAFRAPTTIKPVTENMPFTFDLNKDYVGNIVNAESLETKSFLNKVGNYATYVAGKVVESTTENFSAAAGQGIAVKAGLAPEPTTEVTQYTNVIPQFNSTPITNAYESSGLNYGALPSNRLQFFAANNPQYGDFGRTAYTQFSGLRTA